MNVNLSDPSYLGWRAFADQHGTTISALVEVIGLELGALAAGAAPPGERLPEPARVERVAAAARALSQARRRRRPDP